MKRRTGFLLVGMAGLLAACAGSVGGLERATTPVHATGEGLAPAAADPAPAPAAAPARTRRPPAAHQHVH